MAEEEFHTHDGMAINNSESALNSYKSSNSVGSSREVEFGIVRLADKRKKVIPLTWFVVNNDSEASEWYCYYPPGNKNEIDLIKHKATPGHDWNKLVVSRILYQCATHQEAISTLKKMENTLDGSWSEENIVSNENEGKQRGLPESTSKKRENFATRAGKAKRRPLNPYPQTAKTCVSGSKMFPKTSTPQKIKRNILVPESVCGTDSERLRDELAQLKANCKKIKAEIDLLVQNTFTNGPSNISDIERLGDELAQLQANCKKIKAEIDVLVQNTFTNAPSNISGINNWNKDVAMINLKHFLPVKEDEDFDRLEQLLRSEGTQALMLKFLSSVIGKDSKSMIYNCLRSCLSYEVAEKFSYSGIAARNKAKTKKKAFKSTYVCKTIQVAVKKYKSYTTEDDFKMYMSRWLQQAKFRIRKQDYTQSEEVGNIQ